ncbi:phytoene/squalene synthase family protein [Candidatus Roizmanbacteria bacterium]|nr:phytoene/squalene synthase family protein [Candidatus Roizmanbacteria bacterium]
MISPDIYQLFKKNSKTYFTSSLFFPRDVQDKIATLYAFVRTADNFVDTLPQQKKEFLAFEKEYYAVRSGKKTKQPILQLFSKLETEEQFDTGWTDAFLASMKMDLTKKTYTSLAETESYIYGSANVIGLYIAKILHLPQTSYHYAELLGKSMQFMNFIRDINEDIQLGRNYFPQEDMKRFSLQSLDYQETREKPEQFCRFVQFQIQRYNQWQKEAEKGFQYIPKRYLTPIKTASEMYKWTSAIIQKDPFIVYRKKIKPSYARIVSTAFLIWLKK